MNVNSGRGTSASSTSRLDCARQAEPSMRISTTPTRPCSYYPLQASNVSGPTL